MIENFLSDIKFTERESALLKHNNKEEKEILPFVTQYLRRFNEKNGILYKTNHYFAKFLKNHLSFPTRKENP